MPIAYLFLSISVTDKLLEFSNKQNSPYLGGIYKEVHLEDTCQVQKYVWWVQLSLPQGSCRAIALTQPLDAVLASFVPIVVFLGITNDWITLVENLP